MTKKRSRRTQPLAPPPQSSALRSRKRARQVTTLFHKYTRARDAALARAAAARCIRPEDGADADDPSLVGLREEVQLWDDKLSEIGGREEYQRASQMNTSLFSTSKWVLGVLGRWGWLDGLPVSSDIEHGSGDEAKSRISHTRGTEKDKRVKSRRRDVRVLEVGAINTQLIEAAARTRMKTDHNRIERVHLLDVKAIDIRSTDPRIQQIDFFDLPAPDPCSLYDVVVNSMVINCVTTPDGRGRMLSLCFQHLRPGGVFFLTLPKLCLLQSKFMSRSYFEEILTRGVGFEIVHEVGRDSPKISFFVLRRPTEERSDGNPSLIRRWDERFMRLPVLHRGKKFRNEFAVTLNEETVNGR